MSLSTLEQRVRQAEQALEHHHAQAQAHIADARTAWRDGLTPGRIVLAGLAAGFLSGRAGPRLAVEAPQLFKVAQLASAWLVPVLAARAGDAAPPPSQPQA